MTPRPELVARDSWTKDGQREIEQALPAKFRGRGPGYQRMLDTIETRISVSGIRGKSSLTKKLEESFRERGYLTYAKQTGTDPVSFLDGAAYPIDRHGKKVALDETMWELKKFHPCEVAVVENQAIGPYTMRTFNGSILRPHLLLLLNIRRDHQGDIHPTLPGLARAFGQSANKGARVVSGEQRPELNDVLRKHVEAGGATFVDVSVAADEYVPGIEGVALLDEALRSATGTGLDAHQRERQVQKLWKHFQWWPSSRAGTRWFHGAEINDVDSTAAILRHIQRNDATPATFFAYFRADRRDRTASFLEFLDETLDAGFAERAFVAGPGAHLVHRRLSRRGHRVELFPDDPKKATWMVDRMCDDSKHGRIMTVGNAVPPLPRAVALALGAAEGAPPATATRFRRLARFTEVAAA